MIAMIHDTWYMIRHGCSVSHQLYKKWKDQPNGSCVTGMCDHHFLEPGGLLSFRNLPKRTSPKGTAVAIQKMFHKSTSGRIEGLYISKHVYAYMGYIYIYIVSFMYNSRSVHQYLIVYIYIIHWMIHWTEISSDWLGPRISRNYSCLENEVILTSPKIHPNTLQ